MPVRMSHPLHGVTHAVGSEVEWNIANGWKIDPANGNGKSVEPVTVAKIVLTQAEQFAEQYKAKFGKYPHWKMKQATIEAALKE